MTFKVGDRVQFVVDINDPYPFPEFNNKVGKVTHVEEGPYPYTVRFDFNKKEWPAKEVELIKEVKQRRKA